MILILLSWIYITFTTVNLGVLFSKLMRLRVNDFSVTGILGLFLITCAATLWAVFGRIGLEFHVALLAVNGILTLTFRKNISDVYNRFRQQLIAMPVGLKFILGINTLLIVAQCASAPYVIDNESYYIQTIKWINEYGLVKGVANIHFFLAQTSGWHITQSALNFSFLYGNFNDISGYCLLLGNIFAMVRMADYFRNGSRHYLVIALLPVANLLLFQFISAPSPDIPVYILSFMVFFYFMEHYKDPDTSLFVLIVVLTLFAIYIKTTAAALLAIPLLLLISNFRTLRPALAKCFLYGITVLALFITKNTIVSGHPLFPVTGYQFASNDYSLPQQIADQYFSFTKLCAYFVTPAQFDTMTPADKFIRWIMLPKLHGLFNKIVTVLLVVLPLLIYRYYNRRGMWLLYLTLCCQMALLAVSSPQYRFFLNFILLFSFFIATLFMSKRKLIMPLLALSVAATAFVLFVPLTLNRFTKNRFVLETSTFSFDHILLPHHNSKYDSRFEAITEGNLRYYTPDNIDFYWGTGDGPLPTVNKKQLWRFYRKYGVFPQQRTDDMADGFYAKEMKNEE
jgi:hypothetical protein